MRTDVALRFVRRHGIVLVSAKGAVPNIVDFIAGERVIGSWWGHAEGRRIFRTLARVTDSAEVLVCRLVAGKLTLVHRRLWPSIVRLADRLPRARLAQELQQHTPAGHHIRRTAPFPSWVPRATLTRAGHLAERDALAAIEPWIRSGVVTLTLTRPGR